MPLFNSILGFNLKVSTALSHTTVSVSAVASSLYGFYQARCALLRIWPLCAQQDNATRGCAWCRCRRQAVHSQHRGAEEPRTQTSPNDSSRPLADLDLVVTFLPALLLGVSVGAQRPAACAQCRAW